MRIILIILTLFTLVNCSSNKDCSDVRYIFSNCDLNIPIVRINYSNQFDSIRQNIQNEFEADLCEKCSWIDFKIPFKFEGKKGYLKVMADFDYPVCNNCGVPIRLRYYYSIRVNKKNQLLRDGQPMELDSLRSSILRYFDNIGNPEGHYPEKYRQVNFRLIWDRETEQTTINKLLTEISKAYLTFMEQKSSELGFDFCELTSEELKKMKKKYPLRIEFDLGKIDLMEPNFKKLNQHKDVPMIE